jgi:hypothetical protein
MQRIGAFGKSGVAAEVVKSIVEIVHSKRAGSPARPRPNCFPNFEDPDRYPDLNSALQIR